VTGLRPVRTEFPIDKRQSFGFIISGVKIQDSRFKIQDSKLNMQFKLKVIPGQIFLTKTKEAQNKSIIPLKIQLFS